jgi:RHS repeat-associated protein
VLGQQGHYPFGGSWYSSSTTAKWSFTTYERDAESGNDYTTFRYDSSRLGRFMAPDPLAGYPANPQSLNRYAYVLNDPINLFAPFGLEDCGGGGGIQVRLIECLRGEPR